MLLSALVHIRLFQIRGSSPESINDSHAFSTAAERGREEPKKLAVLQECPQGQVPLRQACNFLSFEDLADLWWKQQAAEGWDWKRRCPLQHCWKKNKSGTTARQSLLQGCSVHYSLSQRTFLRELRERKEMQHCFDALQRRPTDTDISSRELSSVLPPCE